MISLYLGVANSFLISINSFFISSSNFCLEFNISKYPFISNIIFSKMKIGPPVGKPVAIRVSGDDLKTMKIVSLDIQKQLSLKDIIRI